MTTRLTAINLKTTDDREADKVLTLFSLEKGLLKVRAKGIKKGTARLRYAALPFCFGFYTVTEGKNPVLCGCEPEEFFSEIREDVLCFHAGATAAELCVLLSRSGQPDPALFALMLAVLKELAFEPAPLSALIRFFLGALEAEGYELNLDIPARSATRFSESAGFNTLRGVTVDPKTVQDLSKVRSGGAVSPEEAAAALRFLGNAVFLLTGETLNSLKVLLPLLRDPGA